MKKINLMDIMESLNSDNEADAQAALHEWFVEKSKTLVGKLNESEEESDDETEEKVDEAHDYGMMEAQPEDMMSGGGSVGHSGGGAVGMVGEAEASHDYSEVTLIDDDMFEVSDEAGEAIRNGETSGIIKGIDWMRTGIQGDVVWAVEGSDVNAIAAQAGFNNPQMSGTDYIDNDEGENVDFDWLAFNVTGEPKLQDSDDSDSDDSDSDDMEDFDYGPTSYPDPSTMSDKDLITAVHKSSMTDAEPYRSLFKKLHPEYLKRGLADSAKQRAAFANESRRPTVESLIAELSEGFAGLETVSDKLQNVEGAQVGEEGKVPVNKKSTLPNNKADKRLAGEPVEVKSNGHTGHALEKAPAVKDAPVKHHVQNSKDDPKKVSAEKSALLNKMDGSVNTQSPISGKGAKGLKK